MSLPSQKTVMQKTSNDLQASLVEFQRAQQVVSVQHQRTVVRGVRMVFDDHPFEDVFFGLFYLVYSYIASPPSEHENTLARHQAQIPQQQLSPHELAYQESLIQEEIREIESGIHELAEIFQDLGTLVHQQGGMLDNIESNISSVSADVSSGADELRTASEYQRKAGRRAACLMVILVVVTAVVLLAKSRSQEFMCLFLTNACRFCLENILPISFLLICTPFTPTSCYEAFSRPRDLDSQNLHPFRSTLSFPCSHFLLCYLIPLP
ncbi:t-SNARE [Mycena haematopus]|nr:t-SNARE [Mycena haematopus]